MLRITVKMTTGISFNGTVKTLPNVPRFLKKGGSSMMPTQAHRVMQCNTE
jgi:hypothetical protein